MVFTITSAFNKFKENLEITQLQTTTVSNRQQNVRAAVEKEMDVLDSFLTGSYSRHTMIAPLNEADIARARAALTAVSTFLNPNEKANRHQNAGNDFNSLRNKARIFQKIEVNTVADEKELVKMLRQLNDERSRLNKDAPQIPHRAYEKAKKGIESGEA
jgi:hypothetical protein